MNDVSTNPLIRVEKLSYAYGARRVLNDLNFSVQPAEIVGLLGANGSGKSTTLHLLSGLQRAQSGTLSIRGAHSALGSRAFRSLSTIVFQRPSVDPRLSTYENMQLAARLYGLDARTAHTYIDALLALMQLTDRAHDLVKDFSGGMKRKLDLARALLARPQLLLLDEPTSGLDQHSFETLWHHLARLRSENKLSVLLTTHRPEEAQMCDRLIILHEGTALREGTPKALVEELAGDVITLSGADLTMLSEGLKTKFALNTKVIQNELWLEVKEAHTWVPKIVEAFPNGQITSIAMRKPTLADVFAKLTGAGLTQQSEQSS